MPVAGIIAEYNPFHNGHLYQIKEVKKKFPDAPLVVAMSGNFCNGANQLALTSGRGPNKL